MLKCGSTEKNHLFTLFARLFTYFLGSCTHFTWFGVDFKEFPKPDAWKDEKCCNAIANWVALLKQKMVWIYTNGSYKSQFVKKVFWMWIFATLLATKSLRRHVFVLYALTWSNMNTIFFDNELRFRIQKPALLRLSGYDNDNSKVFLFPDKKSQLKKIRIEFWQTHTQQHIITI